MKTKAERIRKTQRDTEQKVEAYFRQLLAALEAKVFWESLAAWKDQERDYKNLYWVYFSEWRLIEVDGESLVLLN